MKENSPISREARRYCQRGGVGMAECANDEIGRRRLPKNNDRDRQEHGERPFDQDSRVEEHAHGDEEEDGAAGSREPARPARLWSGRVQAVRLAATTPRQDAVLKLTNWLASI
ncbi:hypothetical protein M527_03040 [Sphingobium indicum IP26]|uniref:Uncharacterized protein n=1 Tax=Sphingobium indicum F2 TaxID=1450518 RepID=A0A8E0WVJ2_9SPHN|nr:hypothetical protein M527_03040 [Sphingobium indicum IP26]KER38200.1 hypothetical protein AL00_02405 [Sphingobium indicum F2]